MRKSGQNVPANVANHSGGLVLARDSQLIILSFAAASTVLLAGLVYVSSGPYSLDEAIYILMVEAARAGRLAIENGYDLFPSDSLKILFLREGPLGLVPQYPSGYGFLALPFYLAAGVRGLILMNVLAYIAAMAVTYGLARQLHASPRWSLAAGMIFGFATFGITYAYGIWPHAIATTSVAGSALSVLVSTSEANSRKAAAFVLFGGLLAGFGTTIRADVILVVPPVMVWLMAQREYWLRAVLFVAALIPGLLAAAWLNFLKFGSWAPLDYGSGSGSTTLSAYWLLFPTIAVAMILALALSSRRVRSLCALRNMVFAAGASIIALLMIDTTRSLMLRIATGFFVLIVDFQAYSPAKWEETSFGLSDSGHLLLIGQLKRALVQSLPFLGLLPILIPTDRDERRSVHALFLLIAVLWVVPFALRHWHGGSVQNMRYFLPTLPFLSALTAAALERFSREADLTDRRRRLLLIAAAFVAGPSAIVIFIGVSMRDGLALSLATGGSLALAGTTFAAALLVIFSSGFLRRRAARVGLALGLVGLVWSATSGLLSDFAVSQALRSANFKSNLSAAEIAEEALIVTPYAYRFMPQLLREDSYVAIPGRRFADARVLIDYHLSHSHKVYVDESIAAKIASALDGPALEMTPFPFGQHELVELRMPSLTQSVEAPTGVDEKKLP